MIRLFDVQAAFGGAKPGELDPVSAETLVAEMARLGIARALVRIGPDDLDCDAVHSNEMLLENCQRHKELVPCPVAMPSMAGGMPTETEQVSALVGAGAGAVYVRPKHDYWSLDKWMSGRLFAALEAQRVPVICFESMVSSTDAAELAGRYPELPMIFVLADYRWQGRAMALQEAFGNVYLSIGLRYSAHYGIETTVRRLGAERLVFGTGFGEAEPAAAVTQLLYADISAEEKALIGSGNIERLIGGIER